MAVYVALRKESVDRNLEAVSMVRWTLVALRKESVDRNLFAQSVKKWGLRRSPQGERG